MNSTVKTVIFWLVIVVSAILLWQVVRSGSTAQKDRQINFSEFLTSVDQGNVSEVTINAQEVRGKMKDEADSAPRSGELSRHDQDAAG